MISFLKRNSKESTMEKLKANGAFANTKAGKIYIGIDDNGNVKIKK